MHVRSLSLRNFRNIENATVELSPEINSFHGKNAQGKTNLLEALFFLCTGRSFRTRKLDELVYHSAPGFTLEAEIVKRGVAHHLLVSYQSGVKQLQLDREKMSSFSPLIGTFPSVYFSPSDTSLITGTPSRRRRFFDLHLSQQEPLYFHALIRYYKAMKAKNALLRAQRKQELSYFDRLMAKEASELISKRITFLEQLENEVSKWSATFTQGHDLLSFHYHPSVTDSTPEEREKALLALYEKYQPKELLLGKTLHGPHVEDFSFSINDRAAKTYASEGQKRSAIAAVHFAEWKILEKQTSSIPLMCIDDFGVFLDKERQSNLLGALPELQQVFLTSPHAIEQGEQFSIESGKIHSLTKT